MKKVASSRPKSVSRIAAPRRSAVAIRARLTPHPPALRRALPLPQGEGKLAEPPLPLLWERVGVRGDSDSVLADAAIAGLDRAGAEQQAVDAGRMRGGGDELEHEDEGRRLLMRAL